MVRPLSQPVSIEETYRLSPKTNFGNPSAIADGIPQDAFPMVGVAMTLQLDEPLPEVTASGAGVAEVKDDGAGSGTGAGPDGRGGDDVGGCSGDGVPVITIEDSVDGGGGDDGKAAEVESRKSPIESRRAGGGAGVDLMGGGDATTDLLINPSKPRTPTKSAPARADPTTDASCTTSGAATTGKKASGPREPGGDFTPLPMPSISNVVPQPHPTISQVSVIERQEELRNSVLQNP